MKVKNVELFEMKGNKKFFSSTNRMWNTERFNSPFLWGYVSQLIGEEEFKKKEDWLEYYFRSGEERLRQIKALPSKWRDVVTSYDTTPPKDTPKWVLNLNHSYGRTEEECKKMAKMMYEKRVKNIKPKISEEEWEHMVFYRVFGETWNGVVAREKSTAASIQQVLPIELRKVKGSLDYKYAIDYEVYVEDTLLCALQVKPKSYLYGNSQALVTAKEANKIKNIQYRKKTGKPVLYVYSEHNGEVSNTSVLEEINNLIKENKKEKAV